MSITRNIIFSPSREGLRKYRISHLTGNIIDFSGSKKMYDIAILELFYLFAILYLLYGYYNKPSYAYINRKYVLPVIVLIVVTIINNLIY
jgi:hypothetical protein